MSNFCFLSFLTWCCRRGLRRVWWILGGFFPSGLERWRNLRVSGWDGEHVLEASVWIDWKGSTGDVVS